ncbi:MAG TPA: Ppx/GppA family phosphatase [Patescibacteria group bacterium]|nr:Ppx/GppA family phosphatase [Patescibacteria group bacterium]
MPEASSKDYVAVLDIGSNAVRFVVYDGLNRAPFKIHNERTQCHLGKHLATTGMLNPDGVNAAFEAIGRYAGLIKAMKIKQVKAVATAAMRDAKDGGDFIKKVKSEFGLKIDIIEGEEEARLASQGVMMNGLGANGVIGDYGGGSLELIVVEKDVVKHKTSLPIGAHRLHAIQGEAAQKKAVEEQLAGVPFLQNYEGRDFYAMGGAWRSMARAHMRMIKHPVLMLDHYTIDGKKAADYAAYIAKQSPASLAKTVGMMEKRVHDIGVAAMAMACVFDILKPSRLIFSGTGLREGLLYDQLAPAVQKEDSLLASCEKIARQVSRFSDHDGFEALYKWIAPLYGAADAQTKKLLKASCLLSDIGWFEHEDYQADHAFERILVMPFYGTDHAGRAHLALTQYVRYGGDPDRKSETVQKLLTEKDVTVATVTGLALATGYLLTGGALGLLKDSELILEGKTITLNLRAKSHMLNAEVVTKAFGRLADAMGKDAVIKTA